MWLCLFSAQQRLALEAQQRALAAGRGMVGLTPAQLHALALPPVRSPDTCSLDCAAGIWLGCTPARKHEFALLPARMRVLRTGGLSAPNT